MDFLDSIDLKKKQKKSRRVRSWYLYEQYKSLERNQLDAAQKLKERSHQDRILRQELSERRARRQLYDQFGVCHSESCLDKSEGKTSLSASTDDFFESFCELQEDERSSPDTERDTDTEDAYSQDDSQTGKRYIEDFKSLDNIKDDQSFTDSVNSVVQKHKPNENYSDDLKDEIKQDKKNIAEEINLQFETVKENLQCLEKYSKLCSDDKISEVDSSESFGEDCMKVSRARQESDLNLFNIWSKLVSFAYQVIQLNHGNCYYDYSSQFLTAVLACDVLRKGVNSMCNILQPYVSPIKFVTDESDASTASYKRTRRKKLSSNSKKSKKPTLKTTPKTSKKKKVRSNKNCTSADNWRDLSSHTFGFKNRLKRMSDEPWRSAAFESCQSNSSSCSLWPSISGTCRCSCHGKVTDPMSKIGQYIDRILMDIDDCKRV